MPSRRSNSVLSAAAGLALSALPALAMGYDSLDCPELGERRIGYFVNNGFCDPAKPDAKAKSDAKAKPDAKAKSDAKDCKPIAPGSEAELPEADRTQVQLILRTEGRKECPLKSE